MFSFQCTRCRRKPAIVTRGRKEFLCSNCATGSLWYEMVGSLVDDGTGISSSETESPAPGEEQAPDGEAGSDPIDPWEADT